MSTSTMPSPHFYSKPLPHPPNSAPLVMSDQNQNFYCDSPYPSIDRPKRPFSAFPRPRARPGVIGLPASPRPTTPRTPPCQYPKTPRSPPSHIMLLPTTSRSSPPQFSPRQVPNTPRTPSRLSSTSPQPSPRQIPTTPRTPSRQSSSSPQPSPRQMPSTPQLPQSPFPQTPRSPPSHIMLLPSPPSSPPSHSISAPKRHGFLFPPLILNVDFEEDKTTSNADDIFTPISPSIQEVSNPFSNCFPTIERAEERPSQPTGIVISGPTPTEKTADGDTVGNLRSRRWRSESGERQELEIDPRRTTPIKQPRSVESVNQPKERLTETPIVVAGSGNEELNERRSAYGWSDSRKREAEPGVDVGRTGSLRLLRKWKSRGTLRGAEVKREGWL